MNQINTRKHHTKKVILSAVGFLVLASLIIFALEKTHVTNFFTNPFAKTSTPKEDPIDTLNKADNTVGNKSGVSIDPNVDNTKNTSTIPTNDSGSLSFQTLTQANGQVTVTSQASSSLPGNGTCTFVFEKDNARPVTRSATATSHTCGPLSIPELEFTTLGEWKVTARYFTDNTQVIATDRIDIK